jgi:ATP-dependent exoDNAse (exonuclease V) alpha subunit
LYGTKIRRKQVNDQKEAAIDALFEEDEQEGQLPPMSNDQREAYDAIRSFDQPGECIILTGAAGAGKSMVIKHLLEKHPRKYTVAAPTGAAAMLLGGRTVDALFSMNRDNWQIRNPRNQEISMECCANTIIIDESSMIGQNMGNFIHQTARTFGKTVVCVGDGYQLSPVNDGDPCLSSLFVDAHVLKLTHNHRQDEPEFMAALNNVREGRPTYDTEQLFEPCVAREPHPEAMRIYAKNYLVDNYNNEQLARHCKEANKCSVNIFARFEKFVSWEVDDAKRRQIIGKANVAHFSKYALGCRVVITANSPWKQGGFLYVNGDTGFLEEVTYAEHFTKKTYLSDLDSGNGSLDNCPFIKPPWSIMEVKVRLDRTGDLVTVEKVKRDELDKHETPMYTVRGFPVKLGYASTVHKAQGMTLPHAHVDMGSLASMETKYGLAYVALSRTRSIADLSLTEWDYNAIECPPRSPFM